MDLCLFFPIPLTAPWVFKTVPSFLTRSSPRLEAIQRLLRKECYNFPTCCCVQVIIIVQENGSQLWVSRIYNERERECKKRKRWTKDTTDGQSQEKKEKEARRSRWCLQKVESFLFKLTAKSSPWLITSPSTRYVCFSKSCLQPTCLPETETHQRQTKKGKREPCGTLWDNACFIPLNRKLC